MAKLTERKISEFKRVGKQNDEGGLYLLHKANGSKLWRLRYWFDKKEKLQTLGPYPDISKERARQLRDESKRLLASGVDPMAKRKAEKEAETESAANSFEAVTREWFAKFGPTLSGSHAVRIMQRFERDIFPWLGGKPIAELATQPREILRVLRRIEERGAIETAHRARSNCSQVFRYAIQTGRADRDPCADLRGAIPPANKEHLAAVTEPEKVGDLLRAMDGYNGGLIVRCALRLAPLVFVRPGELRHAEWKDIDLEAAEWKYLVTKTKTPHVVPLSRQAVDILRELQPLTGAGRYVFPSPLTADRPMSDNAILTALRRMGIPKDEMCGHGFRAMARTLLDEVLHFPPDIIEHQLAHAVRDPLGRAYNRTTKIDERRKMMQEWADYLDGLKNQNIRPGRVA